MHYNQFNQAFPQTQAGFNQQRQHPLQHPLQQQQPVLLMQPNTAAYYGYGNMASTSAENGNGHHSTGCMDTFFGHKNKTKSTIAFAVWSLLLVILLSNIIMAAAQDKKDCADITAYPDCDVYDVSKPSTAQKEACEECEGCLDHEFGKALFGTYMSSLGITSYILFFISTVVFVWFRFIDESSHI